MNCSGKAMHALGEYACYFKPRDFVDLLERECIWFELLIRLVRHRVNYPESFEAHIISRMIQDRTDWLRN
jgi:hypothetical protein